MKFALKPIVLSFCLVCLGFSSYTLAAPREEDDNPYIEKGWVEEQSPLPSAPNDADLIPFYVSPIATTKFAIDAKSIRVDKDEVVRYTLIATSLQGTKNISYEGIRCETYRHRLYAILHPDGKWSRVDGPWLLIRDNAQNRQHAALYYDYFCEGRGPVSSANKIIDKLKAANGTWR